MIILLAFLQREINITGPLNLTLPKNYITCFVHFKDTIKFEVLALEDPLLPISFSFSYKCISLFKMILF